MEDHIQNELDKEEEQYNDGLDGEEDELIKEEENDKKNEKNNKINKNEIMKTIDNYKNRRKNSYLVFKTFHI